MHVSGRGEDVAVVLAAGFAVRVWLIHRYPIVFGHDTIVRLAKAEHIVLAHQLPLLQAVIHYLKGVSNSVVVVRYFMALVGAVAGVGFFLLMSDLVPREAALEAAFLFIASPRILTESIVPNQEILMLAGLAFAFHFAFGQRWELASVGLGLACLTRYEAWLACPVLAVPYLGQSGVDPRTLLNAVALFGWGPLGWIAYNRGLTPRGSYAVEWSANPERLLRWGHLGAATLRAGTLPTLCLAALGAATFVEKRLFETTAYQMLVAFLALFLIALLFSAHGIDQRGDRGERFVTEREAHIPLAGMVILAGLGLSVLPRFRPEITAVSIAVGLWMAARYVRRWSSEPHFALSYQVGKYLDRHVASREEVAVLARGVDVGTRLDALERDHGPGAVREALRIIRSMGTMPIDYDRILVHSTLGKDRLRSYATLELGRLASLGAPPPAARAVARPQWVVLWSDFAPTNATEASLAADVTAREPRQVFEQDGVWVRLYSLGGTVAQPYA